MTDDDLRLHSDRLPGGTFARAVFDSLLMRLSDKGGASHMIGESWSNVVAGELEGWTGKVIPVPRSDLRNGIVTDIHRLDTIPGVAARASRLGLKNPDFLAHVQCNGRGTVIGVDAKFSIETAREEQVSVEATSRLFEKDELLTALLPSMPDIPTFARGMFVSPDYNLTRAMFRQRMGHRRMTVSRHDVVLVDVPGADMFARVGEPKVMRRLIALDSLPIDPWSSLLASQYYFRLSRAMFGLAIDEQLPLLGHHEVRTDVSHVLKQVERRASRVDSAWELVLLWDRDVEHIRRQRLALHQVVGSPVSGAELRELADTTLVHLAPEARPSRNQVRKALGKMFADDVIGRTGVLMPPLDDFPSELERVAAVSRDVAERYRTDIDAIVAGVIESLVADTLVPKES
ncbi:MAG: hypothetical protein M3451_00205 [Chloroflexota bacterium]|nr:hypothetical protein [Chloroflexota bacterium]